MFQGFVTKSVAPAASALRVAFASCAAGVKVQRFLCRKPDGTNQHAFQTPVVAPVLLPRLPTPLLPCTRTRQGQKGSRY